MMRWETSVSVGNECQKCGIHVTEQFRRGYGDQNDRAHRCTDCDTYTRLSAGSAAGQDVDIADPLEGPTPRLEAKTDYLVMMTLRDMGETARDVTETVATDGGVTVDGLADELGKHPATIYRAIEDLGDILELDQGDVSFRVRKYREELRALVESAEFAIESYADRMQHLMGLADHVAVSSPFQKWLAENGADLEFDSG